MAAAAVLFFAVVNPLLIAPAIQKNNIVKSLGLTEDDLASIESLYIVGDQIFDSFVYSGYENDEHTKLTAEVTYADNSKERLYDIDKGNISDLSIIEYMPNIRTLSIQGQNISDLSPVFKSTSIEELFINCNPVYSLEGIEQMQQLREISFSYTYISDISPLYKLKNLEFLQMSHTYVTDLSGIDQFEKLYFLDINYNNITEISAVNGSEYFNVNCTAIQFDNLSFLSNIQSFGTLSDDDLDIHNEIQYIANKPICTFNSNNLQIDSLEDLSGLIVLEELSINGSSIKSLDGIENFEGITSLSLRDDVFLADLSQVLKLNSLEQLEISNNMQHLVAPELENQLKAAGITLVYSD